jgi:hypothetical protein
MEGILYGNRPLFFFEMLVDIDLAVIRYLETVYEDNSNELFYDAIFDMEDDEIRYLLSERESNNPLVILANKDKISSEDLDELYNDIITNFYDELLKIAKPTALMAVFERFINSKGIINPCVWCKTEVQKEVIKTILEDTNHLSYGVELEENIKNLDVVNYDSIYIKVYKDVIDLPYSNGKTIYVANSKYNFIKNENEYILDPYVSVEIGSNDIMLIDIYTLMIKNEG